MEAGFTLKGCKDKQKSFLSKTFRFFFICLTKAAGRILHSGKSFAITTFRKLS